ncbi:hypothetical protein J4E86_011807 [Alternaria arbusti]|uniref:uncharacterized protein n=1 Tax=Alternaria arbusti TaxID=232088 RepID=UPI0022212786|nr:uncharacterized protein J4E86_011807 [Alternaria arbusti]KAI4925705.1 hypothetical protein J4E86_011807 [Alternaria arbusti]
MNGGEVLKRFRKAPSDGNKDPRSEPKGNRSSWKHLQKLQEAAVKNRDEDASKRLKHDKKSKPVEPQQRQEYHGGAVFWSPQKVREAKAREQVRATTELEEKLAKAETKKLKEAATLYKKKMQKEARVVRKAAKKRAKEERKRAAEEKAAKQAQQEQEKRDRDAQKAPKSSQSGKRAISKATKASRSERVL